jgi:hypothetical protein
MRIAYVLCPDFTGLDRVGPYEVITRWPDAEIQFLARTLDPGRADRGLTVIPMALALTERVHGRELAESLQLLIEYDPQPPFESGAPERAAPGTLRLAFSMLLGDRPFQMAARANSQAAAARFRRAVRALSEPRHSRTST